MKSEVLKFPTSASGRLTGFLVLSLVPLVTLIPVTPIAAWLAQDFVLRWVSALVFFLCLLGAFLKSKIKPSLFLDFPDFLVLLLSGWVLLSVKNSQQSFDSFYAFKSFLALILFWFSFRNIWALWPELFPWFEKIFFWTAFSAGAWVFVSTAGRWFWFDTFVKFIPRQGFFANQNIAAGFLSLALIWGCLKLLHQERVSLAAFLFLIPAWGITESRGALVAMVLVMVAYLLLHMIEVEKRMSQWEFRHWVVFGGFVLLAAFSSALMVNRFLNADADPRSYFRIDVWISSFKMVMAQPLFGFGPGTFADVYPLFRPVGLWNTFNPFAHNEYLQTAAECGLPAMVLVLLLLVVLFREFSPVLFKAQAFQKAAPGLRSGEIAFYMVLFEASHNSVDFTFHEWSHRLVLFGFVTYALREKRTQEDLKTSFHFSQRVFIGGLTVLALFIAWVLGVGSLRDYLARTYDLKSLGYQQQGDLEKAESFARKSLKCRENYMDPWNSLGAIADNRAGREKNPAAREKLFQTAQESFQEAIRLSPYSLVPRENEIQDMVKRGRLDEALDLQKELIEKTPELPTSYTGLGWILMKMGKPREALVPAQKVINMDPYFLPGYLLKGRAFETLGNKKEALRTYEDAREMLKNINRMDPSGQIEPQIQKLKSQVGS